jgi:hypothetical protein
MSGLILTTVLLPRQIHSYSIKFTKWRQGRFDDGRHFTGIIEINFLPHTDPILVLDLCNNHDIINSIMNIENRTHSESDNTPTYDESLDAIVQRYMAREVAPGHEGDFEDILRETDELDEAWREEGFEGVTAFISPRGEYVGIGRKVKPDEAPRYEKAWAEGKHPRRYYLERPQPSEQTFRVRIGDEIRDVVIPAEYQWSPLRFRSGGGSETTAMYDVSGKEPVSDDMAWLRDNFGETVSLEFVSDMHGSNRHFKGLSTEGGVLPSLEDVADRMRTTRDSAHSEAIDMTNTAEQEANTLKKRLFESKTHFAQRRQRSLLDRLQEPTDRR